MPVLVGANLSGDTFIINGTTGSVSGGPTQVAVTGIVALDGADTATITNAPNLYDGVNMAGGDDDVTMTGSKSDFLALGDGDNTADVSDSDIDHAISAGGGNDEFNLTDTDAGSLAMGDGDNTASITGGRVHGQITSGSGEDHVTIDNAHTHGGLSLGDGNDTIDATGSGTTYMGTLDTGAGDDEVSLEGIEVHTGFDTGSGNDTINLVNSEVDPKLFTGDGDDTITGSAGSILNNGAKTGEGNDRVTFSDMTVNGNIELEEGDDVIIVNNTLINNSIIAGDGNDKVAISDGSTVWGGLNGGFGIDSLSVPVGTTIWDQSGNTYVVADGMTYAVSSGSFRLPSGRVIRYRHFEDASSSFPCFVAGTMIDTPQGRVPVETLKPGDEVTSLDHGAVEVTWIGMRRLSAADLTDMPSLCPVRIPAGALGIGAPERDLVVSPQHRVLIDSDISERMTGEAQLLVPAVKLVGYNGIETIPAADGVTYVHFTCAEHEVVFANGCPSESLYLGPEALKSLPAASKAELALLFPDMIAAPSRARPFLEKRGKIQRLLARHEKNSKALQRAHS